MSLLWVTASSVTRMPMEQFQKHYSRDYHAPLREVAEHMEDHYASEAERHRQDIAEHGYPGPGQGWDLEDYDTHPKDVEHGGPRNYIEHLKKDLAQNGQREPIEIHDHTFITDGHHRSVALMELGAPVVKVRHIDCNRDPYCADHRGGYEEWHEEVNGDDRDEDWR